MLSIFGLLGIYVGDILERFHITQMHIFLQAMHKLIAKFDQGSHKYVKCWNRLSPNSSLAQYFPELLP